MKGVSGLVSLERSPRVDPLEGPLKAPEGAPLWGSPEVGRLRQSPGLLNGIELMWSPYGGSLKGVA
jgi:hypothetical protein